MFIQEYHLKKI